MNKEQFLDNIKKDQKKGFDLILSKNTDYSSEDETFKNFDIVELICGVSSECGILVRMCDKITRIGNLLDKEPLVKDESIEDTLLDLANYSYILLARIKARKNNLKITNKHENNTPLS